MEKNDVMKYLQKKGLMFQEIQDDMVGVFGDDSHQMVKNFLTVCMWKKNL